MYKTTQNQFCWTKTINMVEPSAGNSNSDGKLNTVQVSRGSSYQPEGWLNIQLAMLRLLTTFAGALREKSCMRASFNKIPTNYISVESLINVDEKKIQFLQCFLSDVSGGNLVGFFYWIYGLSDSAVRAKWLHSLIHKASINKTVKGFLDILTGYQDI